MSDFLRQLYTETNLTAAALLIFFTFFVTVFAWVYLRKGAKPHYEAMGQMPLLNDGEYHE